MIVDNPFLHLASSSTLAEINTQCQHLFQHQQTLEMNKTNDDDHDEALSSSLLLPPQQGGTIERLCWDDIAIQKVLGQGSFGCVFEASIISSTSDNESGNTATHHQLPCNINYAVKCINDRTVKTEAAFVSAVCDLVQEATLLSTISHENIIEIKGVYHGNVAQSFKDDDGYGYFLVLELLQETLQDRLYKLRKESLLASLPSVLAPIGKKCRRLSTLNRVTSIMPGIASALEYLHNEKNIVLRDLRPSNIGFDRRGIVKIFDFGLACPVSKCKVGETAGCYRYMPPESMLGDEASTVQADIYSFGLVLWEVCTLQKPFMNFKTIDKFVNEVCHEHKRPSLASIPTSLLRDLIKSCWDSNPKRRLTASEISSRLSILLEETKQQTESSSSKNNVANYKSNNKITQLRRYSSAPITSIAKSRVFGNFRSSLRSSLSLVSDRTWHGTFWDDGDVDDEVEEDDDNSGTSSTSFAKEKDVIFLETSSDHHDGKAKF